MGSWTFTQQRGSGGRFLVAATGYWPGGGNVDITTVRGVPTTIGEFSNADPFGDAAAVLEFPGITPLDDLESLELRTWLREEADIDIYWAPAVPADEDTAAEDLVIDPLTERPTMTTPYDGAIKVWEGFIASMEFGDDGGLQVQCQGALFQADRHRAKPFYPARPWPIEALIADQLSHARYPDLRTAPLKIVWPAGWTRVAPAYNAPQAHVFAPVVKAGAKWTEYLTRATGAWDASLTGFIQDKLTVMITRDGDGETVPPGDQWTVRQDPGRQPVLCVRQRGRAPDLAVWVGAPGVSVNLSRDSTQGVNVIYGSGTDIHGTAWSNSTISADGSRTDYTPLAADPTVYPTADNELLVPGAFVSEGYTKFDSGFSQADAITVAQQMLSRDRDPGWTGTITLSTDPSAAMSRWQVRAGMTIRLQGFIGTGAAGLALHISAATASPEEGTVQLTVDSRFRDLLTVQQAIERTRDPLTPVRMLQVNRASNTIPDVQQPWDYSAGSGFMPKASKQFHFTRPRGKRFPYADWAKAHPPQAYPDWYIKCNAAASKDFDRWAGPIPVLTSERGDIARTEVAAYDRQGNVLAVPFHVSLYYLPVTADDMPFAADGTGPSPYVNNAFQSINPATGQPWPEGNYLQPPDSFIIGWGDRQDGQYNRAGFSPGSEADGSSPTGLLTDDITWSYDNTQNIEYNPYLPNKMQNDLSITIYAMFYAEYTQPVYFMGRLYRKNPGSN